MDTETALDIAIYSSDQQARGAFDGGRITETKPIGFTGDGSACKPVGPLFYWAWASSKRDGVIEFHPHRGFEIISYCLEGMIGHYDTLGTDSTIGPGGLQVIQSGSGIQHREKILRPNTQFFQIWFDPDLSKCLNHAPAYQQFNHEDFSITENGGVTVKSILESSSPVSLVADVRMYDLTIPSGKDFTFTLPSGRTLAAVTVNGQGTWMDGDRAVVSEIRDKDFTVINAAVDETLTLRANTAALRLVMIEIPTRVDYTLYSNQASRY